MQILLIYIQIKKILRNVSHDTTIYIYIYIWTKLKYNTLGSIP